MELCAVAGCRRKRRERQDGAALPFCLRHLDHLPVARAISSGLVELEHEGQRLAKGGKVDPSHPIFVEVLSEASYAHKPSVGVLARYTKIPEAAILAVLAAAGVSTHARWCDRWRINTLEYDQAKAMQLLEEMVRGPRPQASSVGA